MDLISNSNEFVPRETIDQIEDLVPRETFAKFNSYKTFLEKWQKRVNLVSNGSLENFWNRHLFDSLQLIRYIPDKSKILDIGSGGGFPGAVLAITEKYYVTCIDSDFKKCCFLRALFSELKITANIITDRVENISNRCHHFDIITARGFSELANLLEFVERFDAIGVFLKGKNVKNEILEAQKHFSFQYELNKSITSSDGFILVVEKCRKK